MKDTLRMETVFKLAILKQLESCISKHIANISLNIINYSVLKLYLFENLWLLLLSSITVKIQL